VTVDAALQRERAARLVQQRVLRRRQLSLSEAIDNLAVGTAWPETGLGEPLPPGTRRETAREEALRFVAQRALFDRLLTLAADTAAASEVRAMAELKLTELGASARRAATRAPARTSAERRAHFLAVADDAERWRTRRELPRPTGALVAPPGDPFGMDGMDVP
jgi:hypothetical protein